MSGFIGPMPENEWRCPVCGTDPYDVTLHHPECPTICAELQPHPCAQTDEELAGVLARLLGGRLELPVGTPPRNWQVEERLNAYYSGRRCAVWAGPGIGESA